MKGHSDLANFNYPNSVPIVPTSRLDQQEVSAGFGLAKEGRVDISHGIRSAQL
jgi:hypothetical protein